MRNYDSAAAGSYEPAAIYYGDSDCVEYVKFDDYCIYERVDEFLTLVKSAEDGSLVGFKLKGFRNRLTRLQPSLEMNDGQFLYVVSAIEDICTEMGDLIFKDQRRQKAYMQAAQLAANDNVKLQERELRAA